MLAINLLRPVHLMHLLSLIQFVKDLLLPGMTLIILSYIMVFLHYLYIGDTGWMNLSQYTRDS